MILRKLFTFIAAVAVAASSFCALGETVSQKQARQMASLFFNAAKGQVLTQPEMVWNGKKLTTDKLFSPFYVYTHPSGGFVVIAAENKAFPILAFSLTGGFDPDNIPQEVNDLLREYARDIELIRYDSRIPYSAIAAWQDYSGYLADILSAPYDATDPVFEAETAREKVDDVMNAPYEESSFLFSDIYDPQQWQQLVEDELKANKSVALGILSPRGDVSSATVYGKKGDYFKIRLGDNVSDAMYRLMATEFLSEGQLAALSEVSPSEEIDDSEPPFAFYDSFIEEVRSMNQMKDDELKRSLEIVEPRIMNQGSGHYTIMLPSQPMLAETYSLSGAMVRQQYFKSGNQADIDILGEPKGFYFTRIFDNEGNVYRFKLAR